MVVEREDRKESTLQVRMGASLKRDGELLYRRLGTSLPEAVRIFVQQSLSVGGLPFDVRLSVVRPARPQTLGSFGSLSAYANAEKRKQEGVGCQRKGTPSPCLSTLMRMRSCAIF